MERRSLTEVNELDREILVNLSYQDLGRVSLTNRGLYRLIDDDLWQRKLTTLLQMKTNTVKLVHESPRCVYIALQRRSNQYQSASWIVDHGEHHLFLAIRPSLNLRKSEWIALFELAIANNDKETRTLIARPWIYRESKRVMHLALKNDNLELVKEIERHSGQGSFNREGVMNAAIDARAWSIHRYYENLFSKNNDTEIAADHGR